MHAKGQKNMEGKQGAQLHPAQNMNVILQFEFFNARFYYPLFRKTTLLFWPGLTRSSAAPLNWMHSTQIPERKRQKPSSDLFSFHGAILHQLSRTHSKPNTRQGIKQTYDSLCRFTCSSLKHVCASCDGVVKRSRVTYQEDVIKDLCRTVHLAQDHNHLIVYEFLELPKVACHAHFQLCSDLHTKYKHILKFKIFIQMPQREKIPFQYKQFEQLIQDLATSMESADLLLYR